MCSPPFKVQADSEVQKMTYLSNLSTKLGEFTGEMYGMNLGHSAHIQICMYTYFSLKVYI